jgi:hypothetical protein
LKPALNKDEILSYRGYLSLARDGVRNKHKSDWTFKGSHEWHEWHVLSRQQKLVPFVAAFAVFSQVIFGTVDFGDGTYTIIFAWRGTG